MFTRETIDSFEYAWRQENQWVFSHFDITVSKQSAEHQPGTDCHFFFIYGFLDLILLISLWNPSII